MNNDRLATREHSLIAAIKRWTNERLIGDDCAALPSGQLVTTDMLVEGTHFLRSTLSCRDLGWKSLAVSLSDIAAMGGRPRYAVISLGLPGDIGDRQIEQLYDGLSDCARAYRCRIVGGDLTRSRQLVISVTVLGDVHEQGMMLRSGARAGDVVVVSGDFGGSAAGLWLLMNGRREHSPCRTRHTRPLPRLCESWSLIRQTQGRGALMDASDGLADALIQIAQASGVSVAIEQRLLPVAEETRAVARLADVELNDWVLYGGEDYELVGTLRPDDWSALKQSPHNPFTAIGSVGEGAAGSVTLIAQDGRQLPLTLTRTFQHW